MKIVNCLHLEYRHERKENMIKQSQEQGFEINWVDGVRDKKNTKKAIHEGHNRIVQQAKDEGLKEVIVAEDDLNFTHPNSFNYFIENKPRSFDLWLAFLYVGSVDNNNRVITSFSGGCSLYVVHERFYDFFLNLNPNTHIDRELGNFAKQFEYYVPPKIPVVQTGGYSDNLKQKMNYDIYLAGRELYSGQG